MPSTLFLPPGFLFGGICHDSKRDSGLHTQQPERSPELVREAANGNQVTKSRSHEAYGSLMKLDISFSWLAGIRICRPDLQESVRNQSLLLCPSVVFVTR